MFTHFCNVLHDFPIFAMSSHHLSIFCTSITSYQNWGNQLIWQKMWSQTFFLIYSYGTEILVVFIHKFDQISLLIGWKLVALLCAEENKLNLIQVFVTWTGFPNIMRRDDRIVNIEEMLEDAANTGTSWFKLPKWVNMRRKFCRWP